MGVATGNPRWAKPVVLLVDDEPFQQRSLARILRDLEVHVASGAREALELIRGGLNPDLVEEIRANGTNCVVTMITGRSFTAAEDVDTVHHILNEHRVEVLRRASTPADAVGDPAGGPAGEPAAGRPHHGEHPDYLTPVPSKEQ